MLIKNNSISDWIIDKKNKLFFLFSSTLFIILFLSIYFDNIYFYLTPIFFLLGFYFIIYPKHLYYLLIFVLPFSIEYDFKKSIIDLPSEPILFVLAALVLMYSIIKFHQTKSILNKNNILIFLVLHLLLTYISVIDSSNVIVSIKTSIVKTVYVVAFYVATIFFIKNKNDILRLLYIIWIPTLITIIVILSLHATNYFSFDTINKAVIPIYRNHVNYGVFITMLFPFLFYLREFSLPKSVHRLFIDLSILITIMAIYFTYTRGAWLALLVMTFYYFIIYKKWTKQILVIAMLIISSFLIYILSNYNYLKYAPNYDTTIYHENLDEHLSSTLAMEDMSTVERFYRWLAAIKMSKHSIWNGVGAGNFTTKYKPYTVAAYQTYISDNEEQSTVHNYFLLLLTEQGIIALIIFIIFIIYVFLLLEKLYHNTEQKILVIAIALSLITFFLNNTLSDLVEANKVGSFFFINLALLSYIQKTSNQKI